MDNVCLCVCRFEWLCLCMHVCLCMCVSGCACVCLEVEIGSFKFSVTKLS